MGQVNDSFYAKLCDRLGIPEKARDGAVDFFRLWQRAEGGDAANNPFNTTWGEPGSTDYNSVGVKNIPTEDEGVDATARTLLQGRPEYGYDAIIYALRDGNGAAAARAVNNSKWGTHFSPALLQEAGVDTDHDADDSASRPATPGSSHRSDVAALQALCAEHGCPPGNSRTSSGGWDGIAGPGTLNAAEALARETGAGCAALQAFLAEHGHAPDNSRRTDGSYDGHDGPGTQAAVHAFLGE